MARLRSPNFPGIPLEDAVNAAKIIFDKCRHAEISRDAVAKDLGYSGLTGRSLKVLGALNQYGLVENTSKGQMRVSKLAADILHGYPESVRLEALYRAGRQPSLFGDIFARFDNHIPSDNAVRSFLVQSGFTNEGIEKALKSFSDTNRYLEIKGACESHGAPPPPSPESAPEAPVQGKPETLETPAMEVTTAPPPADSSKSAVLGNLDYNLTSSGVTLTGGTNSRSDFLAFIEKLKVLAIILPDDGA